MKIRVRPDDFGSYEIIEIVDNESIIKEIENRGVLSVVAHDVLNAYLDRLRGVATAPQLELLDRYREALEFLESITEEVEVKA
jgi:hypothetical protein